MYEPFAVSSDLAEVFRPLTPAEEVIVPGLILQASNKVRMEARKRSVDIDALTAADKLIEDAVIAAVVNAVKRVLMNPEALRQYSTTDGPFTDSKTVDTTVSSGALYLSAGDLSDIFPGRSSIRSFRVRAGLR